MGSEREIAWPVFVEHKIVIVASAKRDLRMISGHAIAEHFGLSEIKWRVGHWRNFAGHPLFCVNGCVVAGHDGQRMTGDAALTSEVEKHVMSKVDHRGLVATCEVIKGELIVFIQCEADSGDQRAWIAILTVFADVGQAHASLSFCLEWQRLPHLAAEATCATVRRNAIGIAGQVVACAVERKSAATDAIGKATNQAGKISSRFIVLQISQRHCNVGNLSVSIRNIDLGDGAAIIQNLHTHAMTVF